VSLLPSFGSLHALGGTEVCTARFGVQS
jgi:hypothetical protein